MNDPHLDTVSLPSATDQDLIAAFRSHYPFPLDPFQGEAIEAIARNHSVIVSAPTGAGKTLIAEFAITRALAAQHTIAYTTPLKALSNQKYADFCARYGEECVGILTGDVKVNPKASVLVMTTEILRNRLMSGEPEDLSYIVLDECHYMGDEGRGTVWEEIIIHCPVTVQLIALSATVSNIAEIAQWIRMTHRPIVAIHHPVRPVPLQYLFCDRTARFWPATEESVTRLSREDPPPRERSSRYPRGQRWRESRFARRRPADGNRVIEELERRRWLPAIYFIFSRSGCERALDRFLEAGTSLLPTPRALEVEEALAAAREEYPSLNLESDLNRRIVQGLRRGVGLHHAGVLPALKRLTEILFERGLVRVVFATETMSLGIHMPAKGVVIQGIRKRSDAGFRSLTVGELTQMAGRAGRRGIDSEGMCVLALDSAEAAGEAWTLVRTGTPEPIESRFRIGYGSAALLVLTHRDPASIQRTIEKSFGQFQNRRRMESLLADRGRLAERLHREEGFVPMCGNIGNLLLYRSTREAWQRERERIHGRGRSRGRRRRDRKTSAGGGGSLLALERTMWGSPEEAEAAWVEARSRMEALGVELSQILCHRCPERPNCERRVRESRTLSRTLEDRRRTLASLERSYWEQFLRVMSVLQHMGYVDRGVLTTEGRLIARLRHDNELLVARTVFSGLLEDLTVPETAAFLSCLLEESREGDPLGARLLLRQRATLRKRIRALEAVGEEVERVQRLHHVKLPVFVHATFLTPVYRWSDGEEEWTSVVEQSFGGHEGDLIRAFRRLIDLCRQLLEAPEISETVQKTLSQVVKSLDRGIVWESALI